MNILRFLVPKSLVAYATDDSTVRQAFEKMRFHRYVTIPVINGEGEYVGTLRNEDIFRYFLDNNDFDYKKAERDSVNTIIDQSYAKPLLHNASVGELIEMVKEHNSVPVVDDRGCFIGIILRRDVLNFLSECYEKSINNQ
jgi:predicted transcriptional regulator